MDAFFTRYPKEAELETRTATVEGDGDVPPGTYAFLELFCPDVSCDCRRVVISVLSREREVVVATLNYVGRTSGSIVSGVVTIPWRRS
jgi:hypothetical protein